MMILFFGLSDVGRATVVGEDDGLALTTVVIEGDVEFMGESVDDGGADAKTREGAWARHESDFSESLPGLVVFGEFFRDEGKQLFGEVAIRMPFVGMVVEF